MRPAGDMDIDAVLSAMDHPVVVATTADRDTGERAGCLVGFLTQSSVDPVRFVVCLSVRNHTYRVAQRADTLAVHLLGAGRRDLAELFASTTGDEIDKFARCAWAPGPGGVPLLTDASRWFTGTIEDRHPLGDHTGFLVAPTDAGVNDDEPPLMFSAVEHLKPGHPA
ncbi:MAG TPA: flavin reductase family protein [Pseudonocardiaceae bacterium]|nr:flavin reductase family protein [Pseudonocardiaceae bacterium]